jgi:tetratricopeptide (TPR) repeat protein
MPKFTRPLPVFMFLVVALCLPRTSAAEDKPHRTAQARALYKAGEYRAAATAYEEAYKADPKPEYLYNLGQCHKQVKDLPGLERAAHAFKAFLRERPQAKNRDQVEQEIADLEQRIKVLRASAPAEAVALKDVLLIPAAPPEESVPLYKKWWLWTAVGVVVAGAVTAAVVFTLPKEIETEQGTLSPGTIRFD